MRFAVSVLAFACSFASAALAAESPKSMVAAAHPLAVEAGLDTLRRGGNAFDAAVTVAFALNVVEPHASGIGGGGFLVAYDAKTSDTFVLDFRETAPSALRIQMFEKPDGTLSDEKALKGGLGVATPGMLRGWLAAHDKRGKLAFAQCLEPAIKLAEGGFPVSQKFSEILTEKVDLLSADESLAGVFLEDGALPFDAGHVLVQKDLAATFRRIQKQGAEAVYGGESARNIAASVAARGGVLAPEDLVQFVPRRRDAVRGRYRGYDLVALGPPSQGGIAVLQILAQLEAYDIESMGDKSPEYYSLLIGAMQNAYESCDEQIGDPAFAAVPVAQMLSDDWTATARARLATPAMEAGAGNAASQPTAHPRGIDDNTTHFSIVDSEGNVIALTQTINYWFGSGTMVHGTGVTLNNEMADFTFDAKSVNAPGPNKIPRSSMSPMLVLRDGRAVGTLGTPGGARIPAALAQVLIHKIDFKESMDDAIEAPRIFVDHRKHRVSFENRIAAETMAVAAGAYAGEATYTLDPKGAFDNYFGGAQGIWITTTPGGGQTLDGGADSRRDGVAVGL